MECITRGHVFNYQGQHPNILKKAGKIQFQNTANYLKKDRYWGGTIPDNQEDALGPEDIWMKAVEVENEEEYVNTLKYGNPKAFLKSYIGIREYKRNHFKKEEKAYIS